MVRLHLTFGVSLALAGLAGCSSGPSESPLGVAQAADNGRGNPNPGQHDFDNALPHTNGRACVTCHPAGDDFALLPASAQARYAANPHDPLFNPLDADDPTAATPTYDHVRTRALIRITITLAPNLDLIDADGNVVTNAERTISVWRGVPTIENTAITAPYTYDGRAATLQDQALGALENHSAITKNPPAEVLDDIAAYEKTVFSSRGVEEVADALAAGRTPPDPDPCFAPGSPEAEGKALFQIACAPCHGGPTQTQIVDRAVQAQFFPQLDQNGSPEFETLPDGSILETFDTTHPNDNFLNLGISGFTYLTQIPASEGGIPGPDDLTFPQYRLRFYTDGTRTQKTYDLPPPPPLNGRNFFPQAFTVDPGRAIITGDPYDFEAFDMPQLRGISRTAPYFHDGSLPDLPSLLTFYSQFILPTLPPLGLPPVVPPSGPGQPPESLTAEQKAQLLAYLLKDSTGPLHDGAARARPRWGRTARSSWRGGLLSRPVMLGKPDRSCSEPDRSCSASIHPARLRPCSIRLRPGPARLRTGSIRLRPGLARLRTGPARFGPARRRFGPVRRGAEHDRSGSDRFGA